MKTSISVIKIIILVVFLSACSNNTENINYKKNEYEGFLYLDSQEKIDDFEYTSIIGSLEIYESTPGDITNLKGLSSLKNISNELLIDNNEKLYELNGLNNLTSIGILHVRSNNSLTSLKGLNSLSSLNNLIIQDNNVLSSLNGLQNISNLNDLTIKNNNSLTSLNKLDKLLQIDRDLNISDNDKLTSLKGLEKLTIIKNNLSIRSNHKLMTLKGINQLNIINNDFTIVGNSSLTSLASLNKLTIIGENLSIYANNSLTSLDGLDNLTKIGGNLNLGVDKYGNTWTPGNAITDFCSISQLIINGQIIKSEYNVANNSYNPTFIEIKNNNNCSKL
jgi:hypothetical protein